MTILNHITRNRTGRLLICTLAPPLLGSLLLIILIYFGSIAENFIVGTDKNDISEINIVALAAFTIPFSYLFMGLQSLLVALIMEFVVRKHAKRKSHMVVSGALLGLLATATLFLSSVPMLIGGLLIGSVMGMVLSLAFEQPISGN